MSWQQIAQAKGAHAFTSSLPLSAFAVTDDHLYVLDLPNMGRTLTKPALATGASGSSFFAETGHTIPAMFKTYWERNGGLALFGYPKSEPLRQINRADGRVYLVQYFERNRFEYHPEFAGTPNEVLLGLLGNDVTESRRAANETPFRPIANPNAADRVFIVQTSHTLSGAFYTYWSHNGGAAIFGYPISEPFEEINPTDGTSYTVQYFERNRFEYHPEYAGTASEVLLGLLGNQVVQAQDWD